MVTRAAESDHLFRFVPFSDAQSAGPTFAQTSEAWMPTQRQIRPGPETMIGIDRHRGGIQAGVGKNPSDPHWDSFPGTRSLRLPFGLPSLR
jgi:hypothetical protein